MSLQQFYEVKRNITAVNKEPSKYWKLFKSVFALLERKNIKEISKVKCEEHWIRITDTHAAALDLPMIE